VPGPTLHHTDGHCPAYREPRDIRSARPAAAWRLGRDERRSGWSARAAVTAARAQSCCSVARRLRGGLKSLIIPDTCRNQTQRQAGARVCAGQPPLQGRWLPGLAIRWSGGQVRVAGAATYQLATRCISSRRRQPSALPASVLGPDDGLSPSSDRRDRELAGYPSVNRRTRGRSGPRSRACRWRCGPGMGCQLLPTGRTAPARCSIRARRDRRC
jgi:hypothetical protein